MESFKIMEWNINHRLGYSKEDMPGWVVDTIKDINADIIILTECCPRVPNWLTVKEKLFSNKQYLVFESQNWQGKQNDVLIAVKKEKFRVVHSKSFFSDSETLIQPDHLEVKCQSATGQEFIVTGMRIHALGIRRNREKESWSEYATRVDEEDLKKKRELQLVLDNMSNEEIVIIGGDFNNYRRSCTRELRKNWCIEVIDEVCKEKGFRRYTPSGSSIFKDHTENVGNANAADHFIIKGIGEHNVSLQPYDRSFTRNDKKIYEWDKDFSLREFPPTRAIPTPYPDHAILIANITL